MEEITSPPNGTREEEVNLIIDDDQRRLPRPFETPDPADCQLHFAPGFHFKKFNGGRSRLLFTANGEVIGHRFPWLCLVGPDWPCLLFLYIIIIIPSLAFFRYALQIKLSVEALIVLLGGVLLFSVVMVTLSCAACSDPGIVPRNAGNSLTNVDAHGRAIRVCRRCNVERERGTRTVHCKDCDACIRGLDHHCPFRICVDHVPCSVSDSIHDCTSKHSSIIPSRLAAFLSQARGRGNASGKNLLAFHLALSLLFNQVLPKHPNNESIQNNDESIQMSRERNLRSFYLFLCSLCVFMVYLFLFGLLGFLQASFTS